MTDQDEIENQNLIAEINDIQHYLNEWKDKFRLVELVKKHYRDFDTEESRYKIEPLSFHGFDHAFRMLIKNIIQRREMGNRDRICIVGDINIPHVNIKECNSGWEKGD